MSNTDKSKKKPRKILRLTRTVPPKKGPVPQGIDVPMNPKYYPQKRKFIMLDPWTIAAIAGTAGAVLGSGALSGKGKGIANIVKKDDEPSEEEKATYRGFQAKRGGFVRGQGAAMRGGGCAMKGKRR